MRIGAGGRGYPRAAGAHDRLAAAFRGYAARLLLDAARSLPVFLVILLMKPFEVSVCLCPCARVLILAVSSWCSRGATRTSASACRHTAA